MLRGLYAAGTGLTSLLQKQEIETNNMANAETTGYKRQETVMKSFREVLLNEIDYKDLSMTRKNIGTMSRGVMVDDVVTIYEQGIIAASERDLDLAIDGEGYFTIRDAEGQEYHTRDGGFKLNFEGILVNNNGLEVMGENGPIALQGTTVSIEQDGDVFLDGEFVDRLQLVNLEDPVKVGSNRFLPTEGNEPVPFDNTTGRVVQGFLEQSNANVVDSMTRFISLTRAYEMNQRMIQTYDTTLEKAINEVGRA